VVRVRENYHSGLLIGSDSKMNGTLNSEGCRPQNLAHCGFQLPRGSAARELVHDLNQALPDGGESGALELRVDHR